MGYRVDLSSGEVVETNVGGEQDLSAVEERAVEDLVADYAEVGVLRS